VTGNRPTDTAGAVTGNRPTDTAGALRSSTALGTASALRDLCLPLPLFSVAFFVTWRPASVGSTVIYSVLIALHPIINVGVYVEVYLHFSESSALEGDGCFA